MNKKTIILYYRLIYTIEASIGGYIVIIDREHNDRTSRYAYIGTTKKLFYLYRWDTVEPYHCIANKNISLSDCPQYLTVPDLTESVSLPNFSYLIFVLHNYIGMMIFSIQVS